MTDKKIVIGDEMIRVQLTENSSKLHISIADLINQYVCRGLYRDDYYEPPKLSKEKLMEIFGLDEEPGKRERLPFQE